MRKRKMRGALVFLIAFVIFLVVTIAYPQIPPAPQICSALNLPTTDYLIGGEFGAPALILAVFNGVICGLIIWLVYTVADKAMKRKPKKQEEGTKVIQTDYEF